MMNRQERLLYHQIHPAKLMVDVTTAAAATALFWKHAPTIALLVGFLPSILVTLVLLRWARLEPCRDSAFGRYVARFMSRRVEMARLAGLVPLWCGAWLHRGALIAAGIAWILGCWLLGLMTKTDAPTSGRASGAA